MERSEPEILLGLDAGQADDEEVVGRFDGVVEQRRLADSRLTPNDQRAAQSPTHGCEEVIDPPAFMLATNQDHASKQYRMTSGRGRGRRPSALPGPISVRAESVECSTGL